MCEFISTAGCYSEFLITAVLLCIFSYYPVYKCVASFLNLADEQNSRAAAIMKLGAAEDFVRHLSILGYHSGFTLDKTCDCKNGVSSDTMFVSA